MPTRLSPVNFKPHFRDMEASEYIFNYFPIRLHKSENLNPKKRHLFCYHPHGVYVFGLFTLCFPRYSGWRRLFPKINCMIGVANSILSMPLIGTLLGWWGFVPADAGNLRAALRVQKNIAIVPGGIAEMLEFSDKREILYLRERKGFIRLAMQEGLTLVPIYGFGENKTFKRTSHFKELRAKVSRALRIVIQPFYGRWYTLIPFQEPVNVVVGPGIEVVKNPSPSVEEVDALAAVYLQAVQTLYDTNKQKFGYQNIPLQIL